MAYLEHARSFRELIVYRKAASVAQRIFEISRGFPREEAYSLTDQVRRSSRSIGAQIAEAWGKRRYQRHFVSKLTDADAEQFETQHWIGVATSCGYLTPDQEQMLLGEAAEIGRMLHSMIEKSSQFCRISDTIVRETPADYLNNGSLPPDH